MIDMRKWVSFFVIGMAWILTFFLIVEAIKNPNIINIIVTALVALCTMVDTYVFIKDKCIF